MHFPEGGRGQLRPPAGVKPVEVKQGITGATQSKDHVRNKRFIKKSWSMTQHIDISMHIFIYIMIKTSLHEGHSLSILKL